MVSPLAYQEPIIRSVVSALQQDGKALMVMATGTGKTFTSAFTVQRLLGPKDRVLFLCHNNDILRQAASAYETVLRVGKEIGLFTGEEKAPPETRFLFASLQTMRNWKESFGPDSFDVVVVDEGHRGQADTFREPIAYFKPRCLLGMTATPNREDGRDIRELFGSETIELTLEEAIARGYLASVVYKMMTVGTASRGALKGLRHRMLTGDRITLRELNDNIFVESLDEEVAKEIAKYGKQGIIFCTSIQQAVAMAKRLDGAHPYHSGLPYQECRALLKSFRAGMLQFLLTVDKFNEGIDIPDAELIVFLRSTESKTVFLQQLGRGLRRTKKKETVTVLDFVANAGRLKQLSEFARRIGDFGGGALSSGDEFQLDTRGIRFEIEEETQDILEILRTIERGFYPTMAEAMEAVRKLGIKTYYQYKARFREDVRLPAAPNEVYRTSWTNWTHYLTGRRLGGFYPTMAEAMEAVSRLGIKSSTEYLRRYKEDGRLPKGPYHVYSVEWKSWKHFITGEDPFYPTLAEASAVAQRLGLLDEAGYAKGRSRDRRLPARPQKRYEREWMGWSHFLTGALQEGAYPNLRQFRDVVRKLKIQSVREYRQRYRDIPGLPSHPHRTYASEWKGWGGILYGRRRSGVKRQVACYPSVHLARTAIRRLGIKNAREYWRRYKEDPRLPSHPDRMYAVSWVKLFQD
jgi:superfamily II DNA or RNA helicase